DSVSGKYIMLSPTSRQMYMYDVPTNTWQLISVPGQPSMPYGLVAAPVSTYGVIAYAACTNTSTCTTYLYKHTASSPPPPDTNPPSTPTSLSASAISSSQINLSWTASTDNVAVMGYQVERCQGSGCTNFAQVGTPAGVSYNDTGLTANTAYRYQVRAADAAGNLSGYSSVASVTTQAPPPGGSDFQTRCGQAGVVRCVGFDQATDIQGTWGGNSGVLPGATTPSLDGTVRASGNSSIKFTIPSNSGADTSGSYFTNFSPDLSLQFGENSEFYYQWRQRFSSEFLSTNYQGSNGWKQEVVTTGDKPGCVPVGGAPNQCATSCEAIGVTMQNTYQRGFAQMYQSCTGSTSHGAYDPLTKLVDLPAPYSRQDILLQDARPAPYCTYLQGNQTLNGVPPPSYFPPNGNCFGYFSNEWMTFQVHIQVGPRGSAGVAGASPNDEFVNSHVDVWIAREGQPSERVFDFGPYNISAANIAENQRYGKVWLLPYQTGKDASQVHPTAYTWYDELIISRNKIADPGSTTPPPSTLVGDLNNDRTVNGADWTIMAGVWFTPSQPSDINLDGVVNSIDFSLLNANWGKTI
ncbi:MAG: fibronectin type III domain-containing protein, partial [Parcubacteria group bacterium Gr01-1014_66]